MDILIDQALDGQCVRRVLQTELKNNLLDTKEVEHAKKVLNAAAFTYVASVLTTLLQILRLILSASRRD